MFARNVWTKYAKNTAANLYYVYMMDFACSNMVIYDTSKSVSFIKVSETYYSTKISEKNWSFTGIIFLSVEIESCCTTKMVRNTFCICWIENEWIENWYE